MPSMISLDGQFKVSIYDNNDNLIQSGDYQDNFITSTGLSYPLTVPFADTFKYLSLGSGDAANHLYTTGCDKLCKPYVYSKDGDFPDKVNFGWTTGIVPEGCGYVTTTSGVEMYRAWRIPEQSKHYVEEDITIKELMTSPNTTGGAGYGKTSKFPYFNDPLTGTSAFSRVVLSPNLEFSIPSGDYAVISYKLNFVVDSHIHKFDPFVGLNNAIGNSKAAWEHLTGNARLLHVGIRLVKGADTGGEEEEGGYGGGGNGNGKSKAGDSYSLAYGMPLEPSATGGMYAYFSTDNTQFRFDPYLGGEAKTNLQRLTDANGVHYWDTDGLNIATGFPEFFHNLPGVLEAGENAPSFEGDPTTMEHLTSSSNRVKAFANFRREKSVLPLLSDFTTDFEAQALGQAGYSSSVVATSLNHDMAITYTGHIDTRRDRTISRVLTWQAINAVADPGVPGTYVKWKSLTFCADKTQDQRTTELKDTMYPFFDSQFGTYDSQNHPQGGNYLTTITSTGKFVGHKNPPYGSNDDLPTFAQPAGAFPYQDTNNGLSVTWKLTWSADCAGMEGACSDRSKTTKTACDAASEDWTPCEEV